MIFVALDASNCSLVDSEKLVFHSRTIRRVKRNWKTDADASNYLVILADDRR